MLRCETFVRDGAPGTVWRNLRQSLVDSAASLHQCITRMRTTVTLDDDVFEAAKAQAQASGRSLGEVLSQLARRGLRASMETTTKGDLPVFKVRSDAEIIPSSRAKDILAEDAT